MILYNVTFFVNNNIEDKWLDWSKKHIAESVQESDYFSDFSLYKILNNEQNDGQSTFSCQLFTDSLHKIQLYEIELEESLLNKMSVKFGQQALFFKSIMKKV